MKFIFINICLLTILNGDLLAQLSGDVSYISSQHYYIRFENTEGLSEKDTLYSEDHVPLLIIKFISERSCACSLIGRRDLSIGEKVYSQIIKEKKQILPPVTQTISSPAVVNVISNELQISETKLKIQMKDNGLRYQGRLSVQNYNTFDNNNTAYQRSRYTFSGKVFNIGEVFSISTYLHYSKNENFYSFNGEKRLNIYDLNINYHSDTKFDLWIGRYLNPRISSLSTIDGLQTEKKLKNYFIGVLAGSRPDFNNMGYNLKLLEYGAYAGRTDTLSNGFIESSMAFFQQTNNSALDRRFIYLQHQNSALNNMNFFLSSEIDLYTREKGEGKNRISLTSLFFHSRYSPAKIISFSLSYDARKNVIYYETFKNIADSILDKETRQGLRFSVNIRPLSNASVGFNYGYRYKKTDIKPSLNYGIYFSYSRIPLIKASGSLNISKLITNYVNGLNYGISLSKDISNNVYTSLNIRRIEYSFSRSDMLQNILSADLSFRLSKMFFLMTGYEVIFEKKSTSQRLLFDLTARF